MYCDVSTFVIARKKLRCGDDSSWHRLVGREPAVLHSEIRHRRAVLPTPKERVAIQATIDRGLLVSLLLYLEHRPERPVLVQAPLQGQVAAAAVWGLLACCSAGACCSAAAQIRQVAEQPRIAAACLQTTRSARSSVMAVRVDARNVF
jgi:hypothetical protein